MAEFHSADLQAAVYARLSSDIKLVEEWAVKIFDVPPGIAGRPARYIRIGDNNDRAIHAHRFEGHDSLFEIGVFTTDNGLIVAKTIASYVVELLKVNPPELENAHLAGFWFQRSQTQRLQQGNLHVVRLWFRALVDGTPQ